MANTKGGLVVSKQEMTKMWIDDKFVEDKDYKYFITELAAIVDSI